MRAVVRIESVSMEGYWWKLVPAVVGLAILHVGCNGKISPEAEKELLAGQADFDRRSDRAVIRRMDAFLAVRASSRGAARAYLLRGLSKKRIGNIADAKLDFQSAVNSATAGDVRANALVQLADLAYTDGEMALAENLYKQAMMDLDEKTQPADYVGYMLGCVLQRQGRWSDADRRFNKVIHLFRGTAKAKAASGRVHASAWTIQAGAFRDRLRAKALVKRLSATSLSARGEPAHRDGVLWHVVYVGRYPTHEQAMTDLPNVRSRQKDAFVKVTR